MKPRSTALNAGVCTLLSLALTACSSEAPPRNGVNDVKKACEIRTGWTRAKDPVCISCQTTSPLAECGCESFKEFSGRCFEQGEAHRGEATCTQDVDKCVRDCAKDCACADRCYEVAAGCRSAAAARDGCVADVCAAFCK